MLHLYPCVLLPSPTRTRILPLTAKSGTGCHTDAAEVIVWLHGDDSGALGAVGVGVSLVISGRRIPVSVRHVIAEAGVLTGDRG